MTEATETTVRNSTQVLTDDQRGAALDRNLNAGLEPVLPSLVDGVGRTEGRLVNTWSGEQRRAVGDIYRCDSVESLINLASLDETVYTQGRNPEMAVDFKKRTNTSERDWLGLPKPMPWGDLCEAMRSQADWLGRSLQSKISQLRVEPPVMVRRRQKWGAMGDEVDMDRVRAGALDHAWRSAPRQRTSAPARVRIVANATVPSYASVDVMEWRGACASALADALTEAGYDVEVLAACPLACATSGDTRPASLTVVIRQFGAPYSPALVRSTIAAQPFSRAMMYRAHVVVAPTQIAWGLGKSVDQTPPEDYADAACTTVFVAGGKLSSPELAQAWIDARLDDLRAIMLGEPRTLAGGVEA